MSIFYDLFARKEHPEFLQYIGSVEVERAEEVTQASLDQYGPESEWLEMVAIAQQDIIVVFSENEGE